MIELVIGDITVPLLASAQPSQGYAELRAASLRRAADGTAIAQCAWGGKLKTSIQCEGLIPPALQSINWGEPVTVKCIAARELQITAPALSVTLPAARRPDTPPTAFALLPNGRWRETAVTVAANLATVTAVTGATGYRVRYYPQLICYSATLTGPVESWAGGNNFSWSLDLEEV